MRRNEFQNVPPETSPSAADDRDLVDAAQAAALKLSAAMDGPLPPRDAFPGYHLIRELARGGQGTVYRARQLATGRDVAIKIAVGRGETARFRQEVRILGQLHHPNIVTIHDSGAVSGCHYFVMDYIDGRPLDEYAATNRLSIRDVLRLFAKICDAVHAGHLRGIIHRDLKPSNIRVDERGEPHVLDFGLARLVSEDVLSRTQTRAMTITGQFVGTLPWASPEQACGDGDGVDLRTDVYSLGVVLYQLLTGRFPYAVEGSIRTVLATIGDREPVKPRFYRKNLTDEVETIVLKCLAKEPQRRYQTAGELGCDIERFLAGQAIEAKRGSTLYVLRKQLKKHRLFLAVAVAFVFVVVVAMVTGWTLYLRSQRSLWSSYLASARATRATDLPGHRFDALATLAKAAAIRPSVELRNEAIAALALADVRVVAQSDVKYARPVPARRGCSPNGELFWISGHSTGEVSIRRFSDDRTLLTVPAVPIRDTGPCPHFSPDGKRIAIPTSSGCEIWEIATQELIERIPVDVSKTGVPFAFSADGRSLAIAETDGSILMHSLVGGTDRVLSATCAPVHFMAWSPTDTLLVTTCFGQSENQVAVRNARTGELIRTLDHPARVWHAAWSPDGRQIAVGCEDGNVHAWDVVTGSEQFMLRGHDGTVDRVGYNRDGDVLVSSDWAGVTRLWDPRYGVSLLAVPGVHRGSFAKDSNRLQFEITHDMLTLARAEVAYGDAWHVIVGHPASRPEERSLCVEVHRNGRLAMTTSQTGARLWDLERGQQVASLRIGSHVVGTFTPDGSALITASNKSVWRWPITADAGIVGVGPPSLAFDRSPEGQPGACCFGPDGDLFVASADLDHAVAFDLAGKGRLRTIGSHQGFRYASVSPDGRWLASGSWGGVGAKVWDIATGEFVHAFPINTGVSVGFSPDGKWLVTSAFEHIVWRAGTWEPVARFPRPDYRSVPGPSAFSSVGNLLAVHGAGSSIDLIDLTRMKLIARIDCPGTSGFESLRFTPDGTRLVFHHSKRADIIYVWDLRQVRKQLAAMNLDWDLPPYPPAPATPASPLRVEVDLGDLGR